MSPGLHRELDGASRAGHNQAQDGLKEGEAGRDEPMEESIGGDRPFGDRCPQQHPAGQPGRREASTEEEGDCEERRDSSLFPIEGLLSLPGGSRAGQ